MSSIPFPFSARLLSITSASWLVSMVFKEMIRRNPGSSSFIRENRIPISIKELNKSSSILTSGQDLLLVSSSCVTSSDIDSVWNNLNSWVVKSVTVFKERRVDIINTSVSFFDSKSVNTSFNFDKSWTFSMDSFKIFVDSTNTHTDQTGWRNSSRVSKFIVNINSVISSFTSLNHIKFLSSNWTFSLASSITCISSNFTVVGKIWTSSDSLLNNIFNPVSCITIWINFTEFSNSDVDSSSLHRFWVISNIILSPNSSSSNSSFIIWALIA